MLLALNERVSQHRPFHAHHHLMAGSSIQRRVRSVGYGHLRMLEQHLTAYCLGFGMTRSRFEDSK